MTDTPVTGGCACGAIRYASTAEPSFSLICQCRQCQRATGGGHATAFVLPADAVTVTGEVRFFDQQADSGNTVSRGFCPTCGSAVYSTNSGMAGLVFPRASSLDDPEVFKPQMIVYRKRAPSWDVMDSSLPAFEGMPPAEAMPDA